MMASKDNLISLIDMLLGDDVWLITTFMHIIMLLDEEHQEIIDGLYSVVPSSELPNAEGGFCIKRRVPKEKLIEIRDMVGLL